MQKAWHQVPEEMVRRLVAKGFKQPSEVQSACLSRALKGESFAMVAPTGTGKTLCYLLPLWQLVQHKPKAKALVLVPTRELAYQVSQMLQELQPDLRNGSLIIVGGNDAAAQVKAIKQDPWLIVATPGRLLDMLDKMGSWLRNLDIAVLDEFDKLVEMGFIEQVGLVMQKISPRAQRLCFSASAPETAVSEEARISDLELMQLETGKGELEEHFYLLKTNKHKNQLLTDLLTETKSNPKQQAIVFVRNREKAKHLHGLLKLRGFNSRMLHGKLEQSERAQVFQNFRSNRFPFLVATDLAARGLDISHVSLIINYDLPQNRRDYLHRTGRTARAGRQGECYSYAGPDEYLQFRNLEEGREVPMQFMPGYDNRDAWYRKSKRSHDEKVKLEKRKESIRQEQSEEEE